MDVPAGVLRRSDARRQQEAERPDEGRAGDTGAAVSVHRLDRRAPDDVPQRNGEQLEDGAGEVVGD